MLVINITLYAQIKIHQSGWITLQSLQEGGFGVNIQPNGFTYFRPSCYGPYAWMNLSMSLDNLSKNWIVKSPEGIHVFFVYGNGQVYSKVGTLTGSDNRFREDIEDLSDALSKIMKMRPVSYRYKTNEIQDTHDSTMYIDKNGNAHWFKQTQTVGIDPSLGINLELEKQLKEEEKRKYIGIIAQQVEELVPEVVRTIPDGTKSVSYDGILGLLLGAVQEQQKRFEELQAKYNDIRETLNGYCQAEKLKSSSNQELDSKSQILFQNLPNPFSISTVIKFRLGEYLNASILLFDMQGTLLRSYNDLDSAKNEVAVRGSDLKPGMYLYSLIIDGREIDTKKMILTE